MKTQVFECFTAEAAAGQTIRLFEMQVPKNKPYPDDFFLRGLPKGERLGRRFGDFAAEGKVTRRRHKPASI